MNLENKNGELYDLYDAFNDIQSINYQKQILKVEEYRYEFPHIPDKRRIRNNVGEQIIARCKSAFNNYIDSDREFENALESGYHHPIAGSFNIGHLSKEEDIMVCIDDITPFYDKVWSITKSAGTLKEIFKNYGKSAYERRAHLYMPPYFQTFSPMIGIIGTTPRHSTIGSGRGGDHGGNLDLPCIKVGAKIILPSYKGFSDVWLGDIHAKQGLGELAGVALECSGEVKFRIYPVKLHKKTQAPIIINNDDNGYSIYFVGCRNTFSSAVKVAMNNSIRYEKVWETYGLTDSYEKVGLRGDLVVGQAIGKTVSVAIKTQISDINKMIKTVDKGAL